MVGGGRRGSGQGRVGRGRDEWGGWVRGLSEWDLYRLRYQGSLSHSLFTRLISVDRSVDRSLSSRLMGRDKEIAPTSYSLEFTVKRRKGWWAGDFYRGRCSLA